jgi:hypothetical protein
MSEPTNLNVVDATPVDSKPWYKDARTWKYAAIATVAVVTAVLVKSALSSDEESDEESDLILEVA